MSLLPKLTLFIGLSSVLAIPLITSPFRQFLTPAKINTISGFQLEKVVQNLDHPTLLTFDTTGRLVVVEGGADLRIVRLEASGIKTRLTAPRVFDHNLPITSISYINNRIYVGHGGLVSIVKPDGTLDTLPKSSSQLPPSPAIAAGSSVNQLVQRLGINPAASVPGPDGTTYLSDTGGMIWRVVKAGTVVGNTPSTSLMVILMSLALLIVAAILFMRPLLKNSRKFYGRLIRKDLGRNQLTKVNA